MRLKSFFLSTLVVLSAFAFVSCSKDKDDDNKKGKKSLMIDVMGYSFKMIRVDGGEFLMGHTDEQSIGLSPTQLAEAANEYPVHSVKLNTFYIAETEVTQELWYYVTGTKPSSHQQLNHPVESVSWDDCIFFINKLNSLTGMTFRLPTEAEWEYAARGGKKSDHYQYSGSSNVDDVAWCSSNTSSTKEVAALGHNELGLFDMSGNVYEWCSDIYMKNYYAVSPYDNPKGPTESQVADKNRRVVRGGSYFGTSDRSRVAFRWNYDKSGIYPNTGLRLAMDERQ